MNELMGNDKASAGTTEPIEDPNPKEEKAPETATSLLRRAYSGKDFQDRLAPYFSKEDINKSLNEFLPRTNISDDPTSSEPSRYVFDPKKNTSNIYINPKQIEQGSARPELTGHEWTHAFDAGATFIDVDKLGRKKAISEHKRYDKSIQGLQDKVGEYIDSDKVAKLQEDIKSGKYGDNKDYDKYLTSENEIRARLNALRVNRYTTTGKDLPEKWESLEGIKSKQLDDLRKIMKDEDIIKALNELAESDNKETPNYAGMPIVPQT
jgi:hypothetical protein